MENQTSPHVPVPIAEISKALAKAQGEFPVIPKDSEVEVKNKEGKRLYTFKYADLTTIIASTRPALSKHGISFTQGVVPGGFATTLMHESGERMVTGFVPCEIPRGTDMKLIGGIITYVKRISLTAALGVSADEDVDAAAIDAGSDKTTTKAPPATKAPPKAPPKGKESEFISEAQVKRLYTIARGRSWTDDEIKHYLEHVGGLKSSREIKKSDYELVVEYFQKTNPPGTEASDQ